MTREVRRRQELRRSRQISLVEPANKAALASNSANTRDVMKFGTAAALTVLFGCLAPTAEAQTSARIIVVLVDDLRFKPSETRNAEQLLALLRDQIAALVISCPARASESDGNDTRELTRGRPIKTLSRHHGYNTMPTMTRCSR
jgi:hypothetical protein